MPLTRGELRPTGRPQHRAKTITSRPQTPELLRLSSRPIPSTLWGTSPGRTRSRHKEPACRSRIMIGIDPGFKLNLYRGRCPDLCGRAHFGMISGNRSQAATRLSDSSYHGGSRRGGYGYGLAADLVSVKGENRSQRFAATQELWKWIDAHEKELGIARPYLDRDPPHVAPLDGAEYAAKRGRVIAQKEEMQTKKHDRVAGRNAPTAKVPKLAKVSSLEPTPKAREPASKKGELRTDTVGQPETVSSPVSLECAETSASSSVSLNSRFARSISLREAFSAW